MYGRDEEGTKARSDTSRGLVDPPGGAYWFHHSSFSCFLLGVRTDELPNYLLVTSFKKNQIIPQAIILLVKSGMPMIKFQLDSSCSKHVILSPRFRGLLLGNVYRTLLQLHGLAQLRDVRMESAFGLHTFGHCGGGAGFTMGDECCAGR